MVGHFEFCWFFLLVTPHIDKDKQEYERVHGGYGFGDWNEDGEGFLDFVVEFDLIVTNSSLKEEKTHNNY